MQFPFEFRRIFTTSFSEEETMDAVKGMLSSRSKIVFITIRNYFGYTKDNQFFLSATKGYQTGLVVPMIRGRVYRDHRTVVELKFQPPIVTGLVTLGVPLIGFASFFVADDIRINGVLREPTMDERIAWGAFFIGLSAFSFYMHCIRPLQKLQRILEKKLRLEVRPGQ